MRCRVVVVLLIVQLVWIGAVTCGPEYRVNYDHDFDDVVSYWRNSTWNPSADPADYWIQAEDGVVTLYYKGNRTDWGNTEVYQGTKPASEVEKSLRFQDFLYREGFSSLRLSAKVRRDIDPEWQGSSLNMNKSPYPQANIGVYFWFEIPGWDYDDLNTTSSLVIDFYFDSRHQNPNTNETRVWEVGGSNLTTSTPYSKQIHAGYVIGTLPLNSWQIFSFDVSDYIDRTLQECRGLEMGLPSDELVIKFLGVYVESFSAAVQASFDYVSLEDTSYDKLQERYDQLQERYDQLSGDYNELDRSHTALNQSYSELEKSRNTYRTLAYTFSAATIVLMAATVYFATRKPKAKPE